MWPDPIPQGNCWTFPTVPSFTVLHFPFPGPIVAWRVRSIFVVSFLRQIWAANRDFVSFDVWMRREEASKNASFLMFGTRKMYIKLEKSMCITRVYSILFLKFWAYNAFSFFDRSLSFGSFLVFCLYFRDVVFKNQFFGLWKLAWNDTKQVIIFTY